MRDLQVKWTDTNKHKKPIRVVFQELCEWYVCDENTQKDYFDAMMNKPIDLPVKRITFDFSKWNKSPL